MTNVTLTSAIATLTVDESTVDLTALPPASIAYLLDYGMSKTMQDVVAGLKKQVSDLHDRTRDADQTKAYRSICAKAGLDPVALDGTPQDVAVETVLRAIRAKRLDDILAGNMTIDGRGTRTTGVAKLARDLAIGLVKAQVKAVGLQGVTDAQIREMADKLVASGTPIPAYDGRTVTEEAERQSAQTASAASAIDLTSLMT